MHTSCLCAPACTHTADHQFPLRSGLAQDTLMIDGALQLAVYGGPTLHGRGHPWHRSWVRSPEARLLRLRHDQRAAGHVRQHLRGGQNHGTAMDIDFCLYYVHECSGNVAGVIGQGFLPMMAPPRLGGGYADRSCSPRRPPSGLSGDRTRERCHG